MPRGGTWGLVLCAGMVAAGCERLFTAPNHPSGTPIARSLAPAIPADALIVESVLLERPLGDPFLDRGLWADARATWSPERRELLARNGLQAGVLVGNLPAELQDILGNAAESVDPHFMTFNNRKEAVIPTAGPNAKSEFDLIADLAGQPESISLTDARCGILVRPQALGEGKVKVWCEPQIQHGQPLELFKPSQDGTQFTRYEETPTEKYPDLGFDLTLRADECLVIGCIAAEVDSLGRALFEVESNGHPRQRVLIIRARQVNVNPASDLPPIPLPGRR